MKLIYLLLLAVLIFLSACQPQPAATFVPTTAPSAAPTQTTLPPTAAPTQTSLPPTTVKIVPAVPTEVTLMNETPLSAPIDPGLSAEVEQARQDLSKRLSIDPGKIELLEASAVTWRDGSLGCPQPGMMYTQALVEGYRIKLSAAGKVYEYHGGGSRPPFLCE